MRTTLFLLAITSTCAASFVVGRWLIAESRKQPTTETTGDRGDEMVSVVVAKRDFEAHSSISDDDLENSFTRALRPKSILPADLITDSNELRGKRLTRTIRSGDFFSIQDLHVKTRLELPKNTKEYIVRIPPRTQFPFEPGRYFDIYVIESDSQGKRTSKMILPKILVIDNDTSAKPSLVSLAVTSDQESELIEAERRAELRFRFAENRSEE